MAVKSFSATGYKGNEVVGTVIYEDDTSTFCLVDESVSSEPTLWLVDKLDDVGVSLDPEQLQAIMPFLEEWLEAHT